MAFHAKGREKNYKNDQPLLAPFFQSRKNAHKTVTTMLQLFFRKVEKKRVAMGKTGGNFRFVFVARLSVFT